LLSETTIDNHNYVAVRSCFETADYKEAALCRLRSLQTRIELSPGARNLIDDIVYVSEPRASCCPPPPHAPARFTWGQLATLAGLKPSGGHFNAGRKDLRALGYVAERDGLVTPIADGLKAAGEVPSAPSTPAERLALWCARLPAPAPEILRTLPHSARNRAVATGIPGLPCCAITD
jgi:hypothetical protein